ncbi:MAG: TGS domain-containing protein [Planctomycetota bacterium]
MPANLTPQYLAAEQRYKQARSTEDKIAALQEMLSTIPKHKGTDHLQGDIKRRLSQLRQEAQDKKRKAPKRTASPYSIARAGAGQVVVFGPPNSGKSALVAALTNAPVTVADYPFSTTVPVPGMMDFDTIRIQLIDTPPVSSGVCDPELANLLHRTDLGVFLLSAADPDLLDQVEIVERELEKFHIMLVADPQGDHEVEVIGGLLKTLVVVSGMDSDGSEAVLELVQELLGARLPLHPLSVKTGQGLEEFRWRVWSLLDAIRVFSKEPGQKPDTNEPFYLRSGETVIDLARGIHKELAATLKFARVWGEGVHDGQPVPRDHVLHDGDIVELHA